MVASDRVKNKSSQKARRYTCTLAKSKNMEEFVKGGTGSGPSLKMSALQGLCLMKLQSKHSIACFVCGCRIWANKELSYDPKEPISMNSKHNIYMIHKIRRHYTRAHPETPLWNAVPESKFNRENGLPAIEYLIHQALRAGGAHGHVPKEATQFEFSLAFNVRMNNAIRWVQWHPMVAKRLQQLGAEKTMCDDTIGILKKLLEVGQARVMSNAFLELAKTRTLEQLFNILMLYFYELGRYKACLMFTQPQQQA